MAYIGKKPSDKFRGLAYKDSFTGDGSTVAFDLVNVAPDGGEYDLHVFIDSVRQEGGSGKAYTLGVDGSGDMKRVTFTTAPDSGAEIYVINPGRYSGVLQVGDNTISNAKLANTVINAQTSKATPIGADELSQVMAPLMHYCIEKFGPDRCMFESNFPPDKVGCSYNILFNAFKRLSYKYSVSERESLFHTTATRTYKISR